MDPGGRTVDRPDGAPHPHLRTRSGGRALGDTDPQMTALARSGAVGKTDRDDALLSDVVRQFTGWDASWLLRPLQSSSNTSLSPNLLGVANRKLLHRAAQADSAPRPAGAPPLALN